MFARDIEHPDITWCLITGYPSWNQPREIYCECCGDIIDDEVYEDEYHDCICLDCLMKTHLKEV